MSDVEREVGEIKVALYGASMQNGFYGEFKQFRQDTHDRLEKIEQKIDVLTGRPWTLFLQVATLVSALAAVALAVQ